MIKYNKYKSYYNKHNIKKYAYILGISLGLTILQTIKCDNNNDNDSNNDNSHNNNNKKGSFLLKSNNEHSKAALLLLKKQINNNSNNNDNNNLLIGNKNEEIGRKLIEERDKFMGPNVSVFYKQDGGLVIPSGQGVYMKDIDGNLHLDCCNNVAGVGHSHPRVVEAGCTELGNIQTNGRFLNPIQQRYVKKLLATFPPELNTVYFVNSGSEANDLALRIARSHSKATRKDHVICLDSAYHGHTQSLVDISPYKWYQAIDGKNYQPNTTHVVSLPDGFRGKYPVGQTPLAGELYAAEVEELVNGPQGGIGVFIAESIVGCGGQIVPPPGYLQKCYAAVRAKGGVCIADEVQTGFGRAGSNFWTFQEHGVIPDIVTMGKPMGNGYPIAAVVCRREVAESFASSGIEYFNTYGGNSVGCAIAEAVIDTIQIEKLQENALETGKYLKVRLQSLVDKYPQWFGEARGIGLFQGIEIIQPRSHATELPKPNAELTKFLVDYLRYRRIIVSRDGPDENVIKIKPPLVFNHEHVDLLVNELENGIKCAIENKIV